MKSQIFIDNTRYCLLKTLVLLLLIILCHNLCVVVTHFIKKEEDTFM